ncbi:carbamoyltransferase HypF [[Eubacterium] cellulosolvens]
MNIQARIVVRGIVQGVGFRPFIYRTATSLNLKGFVKNRGDAVVEILLEGPENQVHQFLEKLQESPPPASRIESVQTTYDQPSNRFPDFTIQQSSPQRRLQGSIIPADIAICQPCILEMQDQKNRRHNYFFITCTDCGPRFTTIKGTPYDRINTSMEEFPMCTKCTQEYTDPVDRRFHAQTTACPKCGPQVFLTDQRGETLQDQTPIQAAGKLLSKGHIVAIKGYGGFHIASSAVDPSPITKLRRVKHRSQKPFAIMARDLQTVKRMTNVSPTEEALLASPQKPILLLRKSGEYALSDLISPDLNTVGIMLPYSGLHLMLFEQVSDPAFIMTSANRPNEPIIKDEEHALRELKDIADYFLIHNRKIVYRCDDSVMKVIGDAPTFIRRSRGFAPEPIKLQASTQKTIAGVGSELNNVCCLLLENKAFLSQHIGDVETPETLSFLKSSIEHLSDLTNAHIEAIAADLHPSFNSTRLAEKIAENLEIPIFKIQHHHAHASKLLAEHHLDEIVAITCDGFGYGLDGKAWGGEVIYCDENGFNRLGHLQEQYLVGGDLATHYPLRIAVAILCDDPEFREWISEKSGLFPHGEKEVESVLYDAGRGKGVLTSSCGRLLDTISALLEVCYERTYEGEPAMKLEPTAEGGKEVIRVPIRREGNIINTTHLVQTVFENRDRFQKRDLAYSAQVYIGRAFAELAIEEADRLGLHDIGFTGGVAYNAHIAQEIRKQVEKVDLNFRLQKNVPCGDGGIALGQAYAASYML